VDRVVSDVERMTEPSFSVITREYVVGLSEVVLASSVTTPWAPNYVEFVIIGWTPARVTRIVNGKPVRSSYSLWVSHGYDG
jgi:hypothetical protein